MKATEIWEAALGELQLQLSKSSFDTWLRDSRAVSCEDHLLVVEVRNAYAKDWLENRLKGTIKRIMAEIASHSMDVRFTVTRREQSSPQPVRLLEELDSVEPNLQANTDSGLKRSFTFENFIVGASNRLAHAAAMAVAERPGKSYNPLFLYGGVGLGKTHLLHAIGNQVERRDRRVLYISTETFTNEFVESIRRQSMTEFRARYREVDVLLLDDVHFIAGKEGTQEEIFHTFNALHSAEKQIVLSSDRPPKAIPLLEERLCSRFEWGLLADIQPPDLETRIAILRSKAEDQPESIPDEILDLIAHRVQRNIRELEGALNRVVMHKQTLGVPLTREVVENAVRDMLPQNSAVSAATILDKVSEARGLTLEDLRGRGRSSPVARGRHIAMYLIREMTGASLPQIGKELGGRDHSTVLHGCNKISEEIETNDQLRREILGIKEELYASSGSAPVKRRHAARGKARTG